MSSAVTLRQAVASPAERRAQRAAAAACRPPQLAGVNIHPSRYHLADACVHSIPLVFARWRLWVLGCSQLWLAAAVRCCAVATTCTSMPITRPSAPGLSRAQHIQLTHLKPCVCAGRSFAAPSTRSSVRPHKVGGQQGALGCALQGKRGAGGGAGRRRGRHPPIYHVCAPARGCCCHCRLLGWRPLPLLQRSLGTSASRQPPS